MAYFTCRQLKILAADFWVSVIPFFFLEFAAKEKLEIVASLSEAQTAKEPGRIKFAEMLSFLESGKADGILSWIKSLNQAEKLLSSGNKSEMTTFLKQIGLNHILFDKSFSFSPKNPFQILAERRALARREANKNLRNPDLRRR